MDNFNPSGMSRDKWVMSSSSMVNYGQQTNYNTMNSGNIRNQGTIHPVPTPKLPDSSLQDDHLKKLAAIQIQMLNKSNHPNVRNIPNQSPSNSNLMRMGQMQSAASSQNTSTPFYNRYNAIQQRLANNSSYGKTSSFGFGSRQTGINSSDTYKPMANRQKLFDQKPEATTTSSSSGTIASGATDHKYNPFTEDSVEDNMDISDDEGNRSHADEGKMNLNAEKIEIKSGASFYKGLILFIPPFEQVLGNSLNNSPAMKMLYASFEFSFKTAIRIENKPTNVANVSEATVLFRDNVIATGRGAAPHIEASIRALELLSETCYIIQAKQKYFASCKLLNGLEMKTLNLKKWEYISEKLPKLEEVTRDSHIQKTLAVFLWNHTTTGVYEDIVFCNLSRQDVNHIKKVVDFFHLTMLPCSMQTNLSMKQTPCIVSIHKYTSAKKLLDILVDCGGENEYFKIYPPDTYRNFYKLHPQLRETNPSNKENISTLNEETMQATILEPYENIICELFERNKSVQANENNIIEANRKPGDDFMMKNFQIDMGSSKRVEPVERMQLLLKYMEQLQEYGSRVLNSGKPEMIKIYHNAIENVRKDLDTCRQDIERQQKERSLDVIQKNPGTFYSEIKRSSEPSQRKSPSRKRSKSPVKRSSDQSKAGNRSKSPNRKYKARSRSPKRSDRTQRSNSPKRRPRTPSPGRRMRVPFRTSPTRRPPSPCRFSPVYRERPSNDDITVSIFKDQFKRYTDSLRKFRIEIEDTPIERRSVLRERLVKYKETYDKFFNEALMNKSQLGSYREELEVLRDELIEQKELVQGKPGPNDLPRSVTPPMWMNVHNFEAPNTAPVTYPIPGSRSIYGAQMQLPARPGTGRYW